MATVQQPLSPEVTAEQVHHLTLRPPESAQLAMSRAPEIVLQEAAKAAQALRDVIERKPQKVVINGKQFLQFEDWQTLGRFYGVTVAARATNYIEQGRVRGYECHAEAIRADGQVISAAQAMCMDDEQKWRDKPLFQLRSMAQTRAQAKALRNVLAWVVVMAGYAPTPAEEMDSDPQRPHNAPAASPAAPRSTGRISDAAITDWCQRMAKAANYEQLQDVFRAAYRQASEATDQNAQAAYITAKDRRRGELRHGHPGF
jgi:hypothetical protein